MGNEKVYSNVNKLEEIFRVKKPIIPTLHLLSLPGAPFYRGQSMDSLLEYTMKEVEILIECGVDGFIVENHGDIPFVKPDKFGYETVAAMTYLGSAIKKEVEKAGLPMGVNCLANAAIPALAIAKAIGAKFVRINQYVNAYVANEGIIEGLAGEVLRYRSGIKADNIAIFADSHVKHGSHAIVGDRSVEEQAKDAMFFCADVLICTGNRTGDAPTDEELNHIKVNPQIPVIVGSGITPDNVERIMKVADGGIVASYFKKDGIWTNTIDRDRTMYFMEKVKKIRETLHT